MPCRIALGEMQASVVNGSRATKQPPMVNTQQSPTPGLLEPVKVQYCWRPRSLTLQATSTLRPRSIAVGETAGPSGAGGSATPSRCGGCSAHQIPARSSSVARKAPRATGPTSPSRSSTSTHRACAAVRTSSKASRAVRPRAASENTPKSDSGKCLSLPDSLPACCKTSSNCGK